MWRTSTAGSRRMSRKWSASTIPPRSRRSRRRNGRCWKPRGRRNDSGALSQLVQLEPRLFRWNVQRLVHCRQSFLRPPEKNAVSSIGGATARFQQRNAAAAVVAVDDHAPRRLGHAAFAQPDRNALERAHRRTADPDVLLLAHGRHSMAVSTRSHVACIEVEAIAADEAKQR